MNDLLNTFIETGADITMFSVMTTIGTSFIFGCMIAFTYFITQEDETYQRSMAVTLLMLPLILAVVIGLIGSNVARAFSLAGTLSIIRFRSAPGDPKDIGFVFFSIAAGLAAGVGLYGYGAVFVIVMCVIMLIFEKSRAFTKKYVQKHLKITIPEDLNYQHAFDDLLLKYTKKHTLSKVRTTDLGSLFEVCYSVIMEDDADEREFLNELRCRNGNLTITLTLAPIAS